MTRIATLEIQIRDTKTQQYQDAPEGHRYWIQTDGTLLTQNDQTRATSVLEKPRWRHTPKDVWKKRVGEWKRRRPTTV